MKKYLFVLLFSLMGMHCFSQESQSKNENVISTQDAEFPGGDSAFAKEFLKMIYSYIDLRQYAVNGKFIFLFDIDEKGKVNNLDVLPKVKNSEMFIEDMKFAIKKVKPKWKPAAKDGKPVISKKMIKINFTSDHFDHD